jgi:hypothetical protein
MIVMNNSLYLKALSPIQLALALFVRLSSSTCGLVVTIRNMYAITLDIYFRFVDENRTVRNRFAVCACSFEKVFLRQQHITARHRPARSDDRSDLRYIAAESQRVQTSRQSGRWTRGATLARSGGETRTT